ncbi:hypothetical protein LWI29_031717 [Acer saccharum]|uniref:Uncharacterized protein n=1 Tax=Acer saccharum TaxID=4024 RepID=A0AA39SZQ5_ACESA|nr:hypothetical protein LWI29_031717 [Acer saccharum]
MHALLSAMDESQYKLIQITKNAHEAWKILETVYEGIEVVKDSKLQVLQTLFKTIRMEEHECLNDFQVKLMDIVNQSHQLGDPYSDRRIKRKIMRSLPPRFESKVTALEENVDFKKMKPRYGHISKICGNLKNKRNGKEMATSSSDSKSVEDSSSDEEIANYYTAFGASHVDVGEEGKNASICDIEEGVDEKVARSVIDVAT